MTELFDEESIGEKLKSLREARGLTQTELGALAGLTQEAISRIENSKTNDLKMSTVQKIFEALNAQVKVRLEK